MKINNDTKILFVCTGNTCRSPMAEMIYNKLTNTTNASSAGLMTFKENISENAKNALLSLYNIKTDNKTSTQFTDVYANHFDIILTMTQSHKKSILYSLPELSKKVYTLGEISGTDKDIIDPYGQSIDAYITCAKEIENNLKIILSKE